MPYYPPVFDPREPAAPPPAAWTFGAPAPTVPPPHAVTVAPSAPPPIRIKPSSVPAPVRVRNDAPSGYAPPPRRGTFQDTSDESGVSHPGRGSGHTPRLSPLQWKLAGAAALVIAVGAGAVARPYLIDRPRPQVVVPQETPSPVSKPTPITAGSLTLVTQPAGAQVLLDGAPAGETPVTIESVAPGRHTVTFVTAAGAVKKTVRVEAGKIASLDVPVYSGWVAVFAPVLSTSLRTGAQLAPPNRDGSCCRPAVTSSRSATMSTALRRHSWWRSSQGRNGRSTCSPPAS